MKHFSLMVMGLLISCLDFAQNNFIIKAKINNPDQYPVFLSYNNNGKSIIDTNATFENGYYIFKGSVDEPGVAYLGMRRAPALTVKTGHGIIPGPSLTFILTNEPITISGNANTIYLARVNGGKANKEWEKLKAKENEYAHAVWTLTKEAYENTPAGSDSAAFKKLNELRSTGIDAINTLRRKFIAENPHSMVSIYTLSMLINILSFEELQQAYEKLGGDYKNTRIARRIADKIDATKATAVGNNAIPVNKIDINGNRVDLQSLKGKYVLVDFWGSWCGPCRMSHPHLKELYAKYKLAGFEIVGISQENRSSLEDNRNVWKKAIEQDGINWIQVLNNEGIEKFDAVKAYGVTAFPTKVLLDKEGKIIARYVGEGGHELDKKLAEIFGN